ncbi:MAG TPA: class I SAM-dependent methyltransferase [Pirellulaceae bacterium]|nr:class I SAM-dependent methyltransferase [Pirellulaceae bacterium]
MARQPPLRPSRRPDAWEDDLSRYALDESPFENSLPVGQLDHRELVNTFEQVIHASLRDGIQVASLADHDPFPLPGSNDREGYVTDSDIGFWISGLHDFLRVRHALQQTEFVPTNLLELGCASGRVLRHFACQWPHIELWACDINYRHVRWVLEHLRRDIRCFHMPVLPHVPIGDNQIDLTCAFSVFTHLDTFETAWIAELYRITRPGGLLYLTFQTESTWENIRKSASSDRRRILIEQQPPEVASFLHRPLPPGRTVFRRTPHGPYRGLVFHHTDYLRDRWGRFFDIRCVLPHHHGIDQTVLLLEKPDNRRSA